MSDAKAARSPKSGRAAVRSPTRLSRARAPAGAGIDPDTGKTVAEMLRDIAASRRTLRSIIREIQEMLA